MLLCQTLQVKDFKTIMNNQNIRAQQLWINTTQQIWKIEKQIGSYFDNIWWLNSGNNIYRLAAILYLNQSIVEKKCITD